MHHPARELGTTLIDHGICWEILSFSALSGGAIAWLRATPSAIEIGSALVRTLVIAETDVVARLRVRNPSLDPVLLPADLVVDGGKQARVIERSLIVPALTVADVPVRCVESGRWRARDAQSATRCSVAAPASTASREHLSQLKKESLRTRACFALEQDEVWSHVSSELRRASVTSRTQSYAALLSLRAGRAAQAASLGVEPDPRANGLAVIRAGGTWIEVLPTTAHLARVVPNVVADILDEHASGLAPARGASPGEISARTQSAVTSIARSPLVALEPLPATLGDTYAFAARDVAGFALLHRGKVAHLAASCAYHS
jgi:hypothetical protein